jgi:hypothetical protein
MRALVLILTILADVATPVPADKVVTPVNVDKNGIALHGYDLVAYFSDGKALGGSPKYQFEWSAATWRFASAANRDRFARQPDAYTPQFGGYCAWAVSRNYTADVDPEAFAIVDGKLYLNYSKLVQAQWQAAWSSASAMSMA